MIELGDAQVAMTTAAAQEVQGALRSCHGRAQLCWRWGNLEMNTDDKMSFIFGRRSIREYQSAPVPDERVTISCVQPWRRRRRARRIPGVSWWCETAPP